MEVYIHNKTGDKYLVISAAIDCTNAREGTPMVVYCKFGDKSTIYVRDFYEFQEKFTIFSEDTTVGDAIPPDVVKDYYCK